MKLFPKYEPSSSKPLPKRRMPFARKFVAMDGESLSAFLPENSLSTPTVACSDASPLEAFFFCNGDPDQIDKEPGRVPMNVKCGMDMYDSAANALRTALLLDDKDDLKCDAYDSAVTTLRTALQFDDDDERIQLDDDTFDLDLPSRLFRSDTDLMGAEVSPGVLRLTERGLKRHERKSFKDPIYSPQDTPEGYFEWKRQQEMRKWWKQTKQKAMERELGDTPKLSNASNEVVEPVSSTRQKRPRFWFTKPTKLSETLDNGVAVSAPNNKSTQRLIKAKSDRFFGTKQQEVQPIHQVEEGREERRIEQLRRKELERQRNREAEAKKNLPSKILSPEGIEVMNEQPRKKRELITNKSTKLVTSVSTLTCAVCSRGERTHIATPCMHFSFCEPCANSLKGMPCPVCGKLCPTYSRVFA